MIADKITYSIKNKSIGGRKAEIQQASMKIRNSILQEATIIIADFSNTKFLEL